MAKKVKIKLKHGKAKIKLKSSDEHLPLGDDNLTRLLGATLASVAATPPTPKTPRLLASPQKDEST